MKTAGVAELKARLSGFLDQVKAGTEILVTERGTPIARIVPLAPRDDEDARALRLARKGLLRLGRGRLSRELLTPPKGDPKTGASVLAALIEERRQGR